jgi:threonine/homoserine/homoserine lactone efflux protein
MHDMVNVTLFLVSAIVIAISPGPGIMYVAARTLANGRAEGIASSVGTGLGGLVHVCAAAFGVSAIVMASADAFTAFKLAGAGYLIWLGVKAWRSAHMPLLAEPSGTEAKGSGHAFREGILVEALNPKTAAFFLAFIPQFVDPSAGAVAPQFIMLGLMSVALNTLVDVIVVLTASRMRSGFVARPDLVRRLRQGSAAVFCGLGISLALARRPS